MRIVCVLAGLLVLASGCAGNPSASGVPSKIDRISAQDLESRFPVQVPVLTLDEVIRLSKAGESPEAIITRIHDTHSSYALTPGQMIDLNRQGVDIRVLDDIQASRELAVREEFADEINQRERAHRDEIESLRREVMQRPYFYDPFWPYPYWFHRYPPVLRHR